MIWEIFIQSFGNHFQLFVATSSLGQTHLKPPISLTSHRGLFESARNFVSVHCHPGSQLCILGALTALRHVPFPQKAAHDCTPRNESRSRRSRSHGRWHHNAQKRPPAPQSGSREYTCTGHGLSVSEALMTALSGRLPKFMQIEEDLPDLWSPPEREEESSAASEVDEAA